MTKTLLKKQMMEVFSWVYRNRKTGKNRSGSGLVGYVVLYLFVFGFLGCAFFATASMLCAPLVSVGYGWLFFALMGLISVALGVFGSVFSTYSSLYLAKDNDFLLSMPIPPGKILFVRLAGVYVMGLLYELTVMIPTLIVYFMTAPVGAAGVVFSLLVPLVLSVFVLILSCVLGWVVALVSSKLKNKNFVVVLLSLAFIAAYYYFYAQAYSMLESILANPQALGDGIRVALYPLYHMGLASQGNALSMLIFTGIIAVLFGIVYAVLSCTFLRLATASNSGTRTKYREQKVKTASPQRALLRKEMRRFLGSAIYMLNCGLGIVFMLVAAVALLIKRDMVTMVLSAMFAGYENLLPLVGVTAVCMITSMNDISSPSVSLEGRSLWLVQSLPVSGWQVLAAKLELHLLLTLVPALLLTACVEIVICPDVVSAILMPVAVVLFVLLMDLVGLCLNLKMPNLNWRDETVPVKQSMCVTLTLFGGWGVVLGFGGLYLALRSFVAPLFYLVGVMVVLAVACALLLRWLRTRGARIFESL